MTTEIVTITDTEWTEPPCEACEEKWYDEHYPCAECGGAFAHATDPACWIADEPLCPKCASIDEVRRMLRGID
jgi:hypothetical protein